VELFANTAQSTLSAAASSAAGTVNVTTPSLFPSTGNFRLLVDNEIMLVTSVSGAVFTVSRGQEATMAAAHAQGAACTLVATNGSMQAFRSDTNGQGTYANRPAAGYAGRAYYPSGGRVLSLDNGSTWNLFGPTFPLTDPQSTSFSWVNQGSAAVSTAYGGYYLTAPAGSNAHSLNIYETTLTGTQATMLVAFNGGLVTDTWIAGISLRAPGTNSGVFTICFGGGTGTIGNYTLYSWTNPTTFSSSLGQLAFSSSNMAGQGLYVWYRYLVSGGNAYHQLSGDGITFGNFIGVVTPSTGLSANATTIGVFVDNYASGNLGISAHLLSFSQP
jgi:hypothetical protein